MSLRRARSLKRWARIRSEAVFATVSFQAMLLLGITGCGDLLGPIIDIGELISDLLRGAGSGSLTLHMYVLTKPDVMSVGVRQRGKSAKKFAAARGGASLMNKAMLRSRWSRCSASCRERVQG